MQVNRYVIPAVIALALVLSFFIVRPFLIPVLAGIIIAYTFRPVYKRVLTWVKYPTLASLLVTLFILALVTIPAVFIVNTMSRETYVLYIQGKELLLSSNIYQWCRSDLCQNLQSWFNLNQVQRSIQKSLQVGTEYLREETTQFFLTLPRRALEIFIIMITTFYLLRDAERVKETIRRLLSTNPQTQRAIFDRFSSVMFGVVYGSLVVAAIQGIAGMIGFWLFGISSPITWGVVMFFLALIPLVGTGLVWIPASLILVIEGLLGNSSIWKGIGLFLYGALIISTIDNLIKPKIIGDNIRVHPLVILIGTFGGLALMGVPGIIVGPVVLAMSLTLLNLYIDSRQKTLSQR